MSYWDHFAPYESVAEKKAKAVKKLQALKKKNPKIKPVIIQGNKLAKTWWGIAWNRNLEKYADYSNRIGRGRSYLRHGAVLDLQIEPNRITAIVAGSRSQPYTVQIRIKEIAKGTWLKIRQKCEGKLDSLQELLAGRFPEDLQDIFTAKGEGLFPSPQEIEFDCSCPDWASMCKHVAATLYGIGARLDEDPELFFRLRNAKIKDLISQAVRSKTDQLLDQARRKNQNSLDNSDLSELFGIDLAEKPKTASSKNTTPKRPKPTTEKLPTRVMKKGTPPPEPKQTAKKTGLPKSAAVKKTVPAKLKPLKKSPKLKLLKKGYRPPKELVTKAILNAKNGISAVEIEQQTGVPRKQIYLIVHSLKQDRLVKNKSHGVYIRLKDKTE
jgi:uncharacterized Zn finger protein